MDNVRAINDTSLEEAYVSFAAKNEDKTRQVSAKRLPSFEAAFDLATELDGLIASRPNLSIDAHKGMSRERVRELLS